MSLWDKWEREKLKKQGIEVEYERDVEIHSSREKRDLRKQICVVLGVFVACLLLVHTALILEALYNGRRWSDTYIVRLFAAREAVREATSRGQ